MSKLTITTQQAADGQDRFELDQDEITIGRARDADVRIDATITTCARDIHARLIRDRGQWCVRAEHRFGVVVRDGRGERFVSQGHREALELPARIRLGRAGPSLKIEAVEAPARPAISLNHAVPGTALPGGPVTVRIVSGAAAPWSRTFDTDAVRIGRSSEAEVRLDPHRDTAVASGIHARLVREPQGWAIQCDHHSGLIIQFAGQPPQRLKAGERCLLTADARIVLGRRGPMIEVLVPQPADVVPATLVGGADEGVVLDLGMPGSTPAAPGGAITLPGWLRPVAPVLPRSAARWLAENTAAATVGAATGLLSLVALVLWIWQPTPPEEQLREVLQRASRSVYAVGIATESGFSPQATAWVVGSHSLATNAHVTEAVKTWLERGLRVEARQPGKDGIRLHVVAAETHPGYEPWAQALHARRLFDRSGNELRLSPLFDVGVLTVEESAGPPLRLASARELGGVRVTDPVGMVSFPLETFRGAAAERPPTIVIGQITALTREFGEAVSGQNWHILEHNLQSAGGASGSPILDLQGRVIALHNASTYVFLPNGQRVNSSGIRLGQNVRFLQELLDKTAGQRMRERETDLVSRLRELVIDREDYARRLAFSRLMADAKGKPKVQEAIRNGQLIKIWETRLSWAKGDPDVRNVALPESVRPNTVYAVSVVADDFSLVGLRMLRGSQRWLGFDALLPPPSLGFLLKDSPRSYSINVERLYPMTRHANVYVTLYVFQG